MTARELIEQIRREVRDTDLQADRAAELLTKLAALFGNVSEEIRESEMDFNRVLLMHLESESKANRARIRAQTTPEFARRQEARDVKDLVLELSRSLKYFLKVKEHEQEISRYQRA